MDIEQLLLQNIKEGVQLLPEDVAKAMIGHYGLTIPDGRRMANLEEVRKAATELDYPLVVKAMVPDMIHKSDNGAVKVGIYDKSSLENAVKELWTIWPMTPLLIEQMIAPGPELIFGLQIDPQFGPCLMIGTGGVFTDLIRDVAFVSLPAQRNEIEKALRSLKGFKLLTGFRGGLSVDIELITDAAMKLARFGEEQVAYYESVDLNPVVVHSSDVTVLDVKVLLKRNPERKFSPAIETEGEYLDRFFSPSSVAVVGASGTPNKIGFVVMDSLVNHDFNGRIYPVTPKHDKLFHLDCIPSISDLPESVDLVIVIVDLALVPSVMDQCYARGIHAVLVISGGGKELGGERAAIEKQISRKAKDYDIRVIGPNCIGTFCGSTRFDSFFYSHDRVIRPPDGPLGMISQSGTFGCLFLEAAENLGVHKMVSYGNRSDVDEADLIDHMSKDPNIKVVAAYLEGIQDGRKFVYTARKIINEENKPIVVFKAGRSKQGAKAAIGHTGAYGGSYEVYRDVFKQFGIISTDSFETFFGSCKALATQPPASGNRIALVSNGAGPMICAIDQLNELGLELANLDRKSVETMRNHFPFFYLVENPVDITGSASAADYAFVIEQFMKDDGVDIIMPWFVFQNTPLDEIAPDLLGRLLREYRKPIIGGAALGPYSKSMSKAMEGNGIAMFSQISAWTFAAKALHLWSENVDLSPRARAETRNEGDENE